MKTRINFLKRLRPHFKECRSKNFLNPDHTFQTLVPQTTIARVHADFVKNISHINMHDSHKGLNSVSGRDVIIGSMELCFKSSIASKVSFLVLFHGKASFR